MFVCGDCAEKVVPFYMRNLAEEKTILSPTLYLMMGAISNRWRQNVMDLQQIVR